LRKLAVVLGASLSFSWMTIRPWVVSSTTAVGSPAAGLAAVVVAAWAVGASRARAHTRAGRCFDIE
jgi:hypothetical protein